jgi:hypothetical protein
MATEMGREDLGARLVQCARLLEDVAQTEAVLRGACLELADLVRELVAAAGLPPADQAALGARLALAKGLLVSTPGGGRPPDGPVHAGD